MRIVVLVKIVPDTWAERRLDPATGLVVRSGAEPVLDEISERALEVAVAYAEAAGDTRVTLLAMSPASSEPVVRKALGSGADDALLIADVALVGADYGLTAEALRAALRREQPDLILAGNLSTDGTGGVIPAMVAELLGMPLLSGLSSVSISADRVTGERTTETWTAVVAAQLPAVVSITEALPEPRIAGFRGIMAAKKKPVTTLTAADLGVDPGDRAASRSIVLEVRETPARTAGTRVVDTGDAGEQLAEYLLSNRLVEAR